MSTHSLPILCSCGCGTSFVPAAPNALYASGRCQKRAERQRRRNREVSGPRFNASQVAAQKLADWHKEQAQRENELTEEFDPVQAAIDAAKTQP